MHGSYDMGWGGGIVGILFWIIAIVLVALAIKGIVFRNDNADKTFGKTAMDILKERYARGEISKEEFEEKKKDLSD